MAAKNKGIYEHFHPEEAPFVDRVTDWMERTVKRHATTHTDFLDPRQAYILSSIANRYDVQVIMWGGYEQAERKRALIAPDYAYLQQEDIDIQLLSVTSIDSNFGQLNHGDFLGAVLGLGIKRDKIGDIHPGSDYCHYLIAGEISSFLDIHLNQVHRCTVHTEIVPLDRLKWTPVSLEETVISVASMRLDGIVSDAVRVSRSKIMAPIRSGKCKVNWKVEENPATLLREGDVISLRGFGRFKIMETLGESKSGRIRVKIGKYL